ncbi:MAG TPA: hypothetical protein VIG92_00160 [Rhodospirillales bacterium]
MGAAVSQQEMNVVEFHGDPSRSAAVFRRKLKKGLAVKFREPNAGLTIAANRLKATEARGISAINHPDAESRTRISDPV